MSPPSAGSTGRFGSGIGSRGGTRSAGRPTGGVSRGGSAFAMSTPGAPGCPGCGQLSSAPAGDLVPRIPLARSTPRFASGVLELVEELVVERHLHLPVVGEQGGVLLQHATDLPAIVRREPHALAEAVELLHLLVVARELPSETQVLDAEVMCLA